MTGPGGAGKTCFLTRFCDAQFDHTCFQGTVGVDYMEKTVALRGEVVKLQMWGTGLGRTVPAPTLWDPPVSG